MSIWFNVSNELYRPSRIVVNQNGTCKDVEAIYFGVGGSARKIYPTGDAAIINSQYSGISTIYLKVNSIPTEASYIVSDPKSPYKAYSTINNNNSLSMGNIYTKSKGIKYTSDGVKDNETNEVKEKWNFKIIYSTKKNTKLNNNYNNTTRYCQVVGIAANSFAYNSAIVINSSAFNPRIRPYIGYRNSYISLPDTNEEPYIYYNFKNATNINTMGNFGTDTYQYLNKVNYTITQYNSFLYPPIWSYTEDNNTLTDTYNFDNFKYNHFYIYFNNFAAANRIIGQSEYAAIASRTHIYNKVIQDNVTHYLLNSINVVQETFSVVDTSVYRPDDLNHTQPYSGNGDYGAYRGDNSGIYLLYDFLE